jgi:hypothetical protein
MKVQTFNLPAAWAPFLVSRTTDSYSDTEIREIRRWLASQGLSESSALASSENEFTERIALFPGDSPMITSCLEFSFPEKRVNQPPVFLGQIGNFKVRVVYQGNCYGLQGNMTWDKEEPGIEFYVVNTARGVPVIGGPAFVSRYYYTTLIKPLGKGIGLCLDGGEPIWLSLSADELSAAMSLVKTELAKAYTDADIEKWKQAWSFKHKK